MAGLGKFVAAGVVLVGLVIGVPDGVSATPGGTGAAAATATAAGGGGGDVPAGTELVVSGPFTGTGTLLGDCVIFHQIVEGGGEWTELGASTFTLDFCLADGSAANHYPVYDGTFTVTAADGGTLNGSLTGYVEAGGSGPEFPLHLVMEVTGGTGTYEGATGSIAMEGAFGLAALTVEGTVDGTVTLPPAIPSSWRDCLAGGWRDLVDDEGRPFRNQGQCIRWSQRQT